MKGYGQFCPVAKAMEVIGERWNILILRELISGSLSFNQIRNGVALMSPTLLSSRLKSLQRAGVIERNNTEQGIQYSLTVSGRELEPIIMQMGVWGQRWARSDMSKGDLDPRLLMWDIKRRIDTTQFPDQRSVLLFEFTNFTSKLRRWWLVIENKAADICLKDPGYDVDLQLVSDLRTMSLVWMGDLSLNKAQQQKKLRITGNSILKRSISKWLTLNAFAKVKPVKS